MPPSGACVYPGAFIGLALKHRNVSKEVWKERYDLDDDLAKRPKIKAVIKHDIAVLMIHANK